MKCDDLYKKYFDEIKPLAEKYNIEPWKLLRVYSGNSLIELNEHPIFEYLLDEDCDIVFALTVIENKPVFHGDVLYHKKNNKSYLILNEIIFNDLKCHERTGAYNINLSWIDISLLSWNKLSDTISDNLTSNEKDYLIQYLKSNLNSMPWDEYIIMLCIIEKLEKI